MDDDLITGFITLSPTGLHGFLRILSFGSLHGFVLIPLYGFLLILYIRILLYESFFTDSSIDVWILLYGFHTLYSRHRQS